MYITEQPKYAFEPNFFTQKSSELVKYQKSIIVENYL